MAQKRRGEKGKVRTKERFVALRMTDEMYRQLYAAANRHKRSLSREMEERLDFTLARYRKGTTPEGRRLDELPPRVRALCDIVAIAARVVETSLGGKQRKRWWNEDRYTGEVLVGAINCLLTDEFLSPGKAVVPPEVLKFAKTHFAGDTSPARFGREMAKEFGHWFWFAQTERELLNSPKGRFLPQLFPEFLMEFVKIKRDLKPRRVK